MAGFHVAGPCARAGAAARVLVCGAFVLVGLACGPAVAEDDDTAQMLASLGKPGDFSLAPPEVTEEAPTGWYVRADVGYVAATGSAVRFAGLPTGLDLSGAGWSVGGGLGYRFAPFLRGEVSIDYLSLGSAQAGPAALSSSATVALASAYWDVVTFAGLTPYLSAGVGFAIDTLDAPLALRPAGNAWEFAWSVGAGVSYAISPALSLDLGYRYVDLGSPAYAGGLAVSDAAAHQVRFGLRYALD